MIGWMVGVCVLTVSGGLLYRNAGIFDDVEFENPLGTFVDREKQHTQCLAIPEDSVRKIKMDSRQNENHNFCTIEGYSTMLHHPCY